MKMKERERERESEQVCADNYTVYIYTVDMIKVCDFL